jgi:hypothetical protein
MLALASRELLSHILSLAHGEAITAAYRRFTLLQTTLAYVFSQWNLSKN